MKKLLSICLLAGWHACFAQNVGLKELLRVMEAPSVDWVNQYLSPLGYTGSKEEMAVKGIDVAVAQVWGFRSDKTPDAPMIAALYRITDSAGAMVNLHRFQGSGCRDLV
jgi:hypothetical protein